MIHAPTMKVAHNFVDTGTNLNAGATIDTSGWDYMTLIVAVGALGAELAAFKIEDDDASGGSFDGADIFNFVGGTDVDGNTLAIADIDANQVAVVHVNLIGRKKYVKATVTGGGTNSDVACIVLLSRGAESPTTVADFGADFTCIA
jgi:hypothetical protein